MLLKMAQMQLIAPFSHLTLTLGDLQFLANAMQPDIDFAVNHLAAYTTNPSMQHTSAGTLRLPVQRD